MQIAGAIYTEGVVFRFQFPYVFYKASIFEIERLSLNLSLKVLEVSPM